MRKRKNSLILGILMLVVTLGVGYAYLNTTLNISGTTNVDSNTWNVYWDNVVVTTGSVSADTPTIDTATTVSFDVHLSKPGDFYEFTVDAVNDGSIDAMIDSIQASINGDTVIPDYLYFDILYKNGEDIDENQLLAAGGKETYRVHVEYRDNINPDVLPTTTQNLTLAFGMGYVQATPSAIPVETTIYNISDTSFTIGNPVPEGITIYDNYQDAITAFGNPFFLKHVTVSNKVTESYVGFIINDTVYYLRGGVRESGSETPIYSANLLVLQNTYGSSDCLTQPGLYYCVGTDIGFASSTGPNGYACSDNSTYRCRVMYNGQSYCGTN